MSPTGKAKAKSGAGDDSSLASARWSPEERAGSALPLRLSVARGGLGLELCEPVQLGPLRVDELEVELPGLNYPLDLSKGVKQFRNRRSVLRHALVRLELEGLARGWSQALTDVWGADTRVRLRPVFEKGTGGNDGADQGEIPSLGVTVYNEDAVLAFDLVVTAGSTPRVAIDVPRSVGRSVSPLVSASQVVDAGLSVAESQRLSLGRSGRAVEMSGLAEALALVVLPSLGCRIPQVKDQVLTKISHERGAIVMELGMQERPFSAGRRALRLSAVADYLTRADTLLTRGELAAAREVYLEALESAPGHGEVLQELADLDLAAEGRGESALSFLQELQAASGRRSREAQARTLIASAEALRMTGRAEIAEETWDRLLTTESDPVVGAFVATRMATGRAAEDRRRPLLDTAVAQAPFLREPRAARFRLALKSGDLRVAASDAEQLEALESEPVVRARICVELGETYLKEGLIDVGQRWLRRALRLSPDDGNAMMVLASSLAEQGEGLRAAELFQTAARRFAADLEKTSASDDGLTLKADEVESQRNRLSEARYRLAEIFAVDDLQHGEALALLAGVETRAPVGVAARLMEAELLDRAGYDSRVERSIARLLEAVEMGWVELGADRTRVERLLEKLRKSLDPTVLEFAERVLALGAID